MEESRKQEILKTPKDPPAKCLLHNSALVITMKSSIQLLTNMEVNGIIMYSVILVNNYTIDDKIAENYRQNQQIIKEGRKVINDDTRPQ